MESHDALLDFDLGESSDDSDFRIEDHCEESDDDSVDSNSAAKGTKKKPNQNSIFITFQFSIPDEDDDEDSDNDSDDSLDPLLKSQGNEVSDVIEKVRLQSDKAGPIDEKLAKMLICCGCLGDKSDDVNEVVECDGCGITVHEGTLIS